MVTFGELQSRQRYLVQQCGRLRNQVKSQFREQMTGYDTETPMLRQKAEQIGGLAPTLQALEDAETQLRQVDQGISRLGLRAPQEAINDLVATMDSVTAFLAKHHL